jgi:YHS domain-containing protein
MAMLMVASRPTPRSPIEAGVVRRLVVVAGRLGGDRQCPGGHVHIPLHGLLEVGQPPADEPTANLDSGHGREIASVLRNLATDDGRSVVIVSHDQRLKEIADRVLWLEDGEFRELAAMATDAVCGMAVETGVEHHAEVNGQTFWFCSAYCRDEFLSDPPRFLTSNEFTERREQRSAAT